MFNARIDALISIRFIYFKDINHQSSIIIIVHFPYYWLCLMHSKKSSFERNEVNAILKPTAIFEKVLEDLFCLKESLFYEK